jgi:hypothetical protein
VASIPARRKRTEKTEKNYARLAGTLGCAAAARVERD